VDLPSYLENEENEDVMEMKQVLIDFGHQAEGLLKDRAKLLESGLTVREIVVALRSCRETMGSFSTLLKRTFLDNFTVEHPLGVDKMLNRMLKNGFIKYSDYEFPLFINQSIESSVRNLNCSFSNAVLLLVPIKVNKCFFFLILGNWTFRSKHHHEG